MLNQNQKFFNPPSSSSDKFRKVVSDLKKVVENDKEKKKQKSG